MLDPMSNVRLDMACECLVEQVAISDRITVSINRGLEMIDRLKAIYKPDDKVSYEVLDYFQDYEETCAMVGYEAITINASCESAWDIVKRVVESLKQMLLKLWDSIKHCFRWLFNAQYRASTEFQKYAQLIAQADASKDQQARFIALHIGENGMITPEEMIRVITATNKLVDVMEKCPNQKSAEDVDAFVTTNVADSGIVFRNGKFVDTFDKLVYVDGTYGSAGWTTKRALEVNKMCMELARRSVVLKSLEKNLDQEVSAAKRRLNNLAAAGAEVSEVQKELTYKVKLYTILSASQQALANRFEVLSGFMCDIAEDCEALVDGRYDLNDDE